MLEALDDIPWATLRHRFDDASQVPFALRAIERGDAGAVSALFDDIDRPSMVYEIGPFVVPFLIELLDAPRVDRLSVLTVLRSLASSYSVRDTHDRVPRKDDGERLARILQWRRDAHDAVVRGAPAYLRLLAEDDERARAAAAHVLGACQETAPTMIPTLLARAAIETSEAACASLLFAVRDLGGAADEQLSRWLGDHRPTVRLAVALIAAAREGELSEQVVLVIAESAPRAVAVLGALPCARFAGALVFVLDGLGERWPIQLRLLAEWTRDESDGVRHGAMFAAKHVLWQWRPAVEPLVRELGRCLSDPDGYVRHAAASQLATSGRSVRLVADELWAHLDGDPKHETTFAFALSALCAVRDPRAAGYVRTALETSAAQKGKTVSVPHWLERAVETVGPWADGCLEPLVRLLPRAGATNFTVMKAIARHGAAAAFAVPAITRELRGRPHFAVIVLGELGPVAADTYDEILPMLGQSDVSLRVYAARAVWRMRGDANLVIPVLGEAISTSSDWHACATALEAIAEIGSDARPLCDRLPPLFDSREDWVSLRSAIAYWRVTGDAERAVPLLIERHLVYDISGHEALRCLAEIGPPAHAAVPRLERALRSEHRLPLTTIAGDEAWCDHAREALASITKGR